MDQMNVPASHNMPYQNNSQMYNGTQFVTQNEKEMEMFYRKEAIKLNADLARISAKTNASIEIAKHKNQLEICKAVEIEGKKLSKKLATCGIVYNTYGQICREISSSDCDNVTISRPILNVQNMCMIKMVSASGKECALIKWDGNPEGFLLLGNNFMSKIFGIELEKKGVQLLVAGRQKKETTEQLFAFLCNNAEIVELPDHFGWNKMTNERWYFEADLKKTMEGVLNECGKN